MNDLVLGLLCIAAFVAALVLAIAMMKNG